MDAIDVKKQGKKARKKADPATTSSHVTKEPEIKKRKRKSEGVELTSLHSEAPAKAAKRKVDSFGSKQNGNNDGGGTHDAPIQPTSAAPVVGSEEQMDLYNNRTIYVEGLPFTATEDDVRAFFQKQDTAKTVGPMRITQMRLARWHDTGRLRGYGHIEFAQEASANRALEMTGNYMQNRYIKVEKPLPPRNAAAPSSSSAAVVVTAPPGCTTVFIKNLPYDVSEADVEDVFKVFGPITSVRLPRWGHTQALKGFGYVVFKRADSAEISVRKSKGLVAGAGGVFVKGRSIMCDFETGAPKLSFQRQVAVGQQKNSIAK